MTKRKSTKRALLLSALSLLVCVSMLVGSTFAWFTDSVTSAGNKIQAGTLKIDLELLKDGKWTSIKESKAPLFNNTLWEPGYTEVKVLKVENEGTLALKWVAQFTSQKELSKLAEVIDVYVCPSETELAMPGRDLTGYTKVGTLDSFINTIEQTTRGTLLPAGEAGSVAYLGIALKMQEGAGNEYQGLDLGGAFDIQILATQYTYESDSFGTDYDKGAWHPNMTVYTPDDLQAALNNAQPGDVINLGGDIDLTETVIVPEKPATFARRSAPAPVVLNLNGNNISTAGSIAIRNEGNLLITGKGEISSVSGYAIRVQRGSLVIDSDDISVKSDFGAISVFNGAEVTINGGHYENKGYQNKTSHTIYLGGYGTININGGTFDSGYSNGGIDTICGYGWANDANAKAVININGGTFYPSELNGSYYFISNYDGAWTEINISGGTFHKYDPAKIGGTKLVAGFKSTANADGSYTVVFPQESFDSLIDNAVAGDTVEIPAGTYTFPASKLQEGQTLNCAPGTVFDGKTGLNINGATVVGATFTNNNDYLVNSTTINGTFKDCVFTNSDGLRYCYAGETVVFENCVFDTDFYGVHFDGGANDVVFKNCTFTGFNTFGSAITKLTMEGCTFKYNGKGGYNGINLWGDAEMTNCTFVFDGSAKTEWVDLVNDNKTVTFTNCVVTDGTTEKGIETVVCNYGTGNTVIVNGDRVAYSNDDLKAAINNGATKVLLADGEYDLNGIQKDGLTLIGVGDDVKVANTTKYASNKLVGAIWQATNLENVTITNTVYTMADGGKSTFTNVNFAAGFRQGYGTGVVFTDCTFGSNSEGYALHFQTDSASEGGLIKLNGCEFEGGNVHLGGKRAYEFNGCDFAAGTDFQVWSNITLDGCTVNGEEVTGANVATLFPKLNLEKVTIK